MRLNDYAQHTYREILLSNKKEQTTNCLLEKTHNLKVENDILFSGLAEDLNQPLRLL